MDFLNQQNQFKIMPENTISPYAYPQRTYYSPLAKPLKRSHSFHGLDIQIAPPQFIPGALANRGLETLVRDLEKIDYSAPNHQVIEQVVALENAFYQSSPLPVDPKYFKVNVAAYPLYKVVVDPAGRYSAAILTWAEGQATPPHEHGGWSVVLVVRGKEISWPYITEHGPTNLHPEVRMPGQIDIVTQEDADWHVVQNVDTQVAISLHISGIDLEKVKRRRVDKNGEVGFYVSKFSDTRPDPQFVWDAILPYEPPKVLTPIVKDNTIDSSIGYAWARLRAIDVKEL